MTDRLRVFCCECNRERLADDSWTKYKISREEQREANGSHTYCPDCAEVTFKQIRERVPDYRKK